MLLAGALALGDLVEPLPFHALRSAHSLVNGLPSKVSTANIRPLDRLPLCGMASTRPPVLSSLVALYPRRERLRVLRIEGDERQDLVGQRLTVAIQDVAVRVIAAAVVRRPLVGDHGGELDGIVVFLGDRRVAAPDVPEGVRVGHGRRNHPLSLQRNHLHDRLHRPVRPGIGRLVPFLELRVGHQLGLAGDDVGDHAHGVGVIADRQPVERPGETDLLAGRGDDLLAAGEAVGSRGPQAGAAAHRIGRPGGEQMLVAPQGPVGEVAPGIGGVGVFLRRTAWSCRRRWCRRRW